MKIIYDDDLILDLPTANDNEDHTNFSSGSFIGDFLDNPFYFREVFAHTLALRETLCCVRNDIFVEKAWDAMCGVGLGSSVLVKYLSPKYLRCSDISPESATLLKTRNFQADVRTMDIWEGAGADDYWDLIFVDFNNFTLTQLKWLQLLKSLITKTSMLIFSDSACFGFHRFPKNLKCYRVDNPQQYYFQLSEVLGGYLRAVVDHYNSAVVAVGARPYSGEVFWQRLNPNDCRNYARRVSGRGLL